MRVLCLDVGEKRVGVAVSDPLSITAQGVETIHTRGAENDAMRVRELCGKYLTDRVLVGPTRSPGRKARRPSACASSPAGLNFSASTCASGTSG